MSWGNKDQANNTPIYTPAQIRKAPNTANRDAMYGNTTSDAFTTGQKVGVFAVDATEMGVSTGGVVSFTITSAGSGYTANAAVTLSGNATANATANSLGKISAVNLTAAGSGYSVAPSVTIAAPAAQSFNANTAVDTTNDFIAVTSNPFQNGDKVTYLVATGNTALTGLANNTQYFVVSANSTGVKLSTASGGSAIDLTAKGLTETGHSLTGETATAVATIGGGKNRGIPHQGYVLRTVGSGGRAGRVQYEVLAVSHINTDGSDDTILPDS